MLEELRQKQIIKSNYVNNIQLRNKNIDMIERCLEHYLTVDIEHDEDFNNNSELLKTLEEVTEFFGKLILRK